MKTAPVVIASAVTSKTVPELTLSAVTSKTLPVVTLVFTSITVPLVTLEPVIWRILPSVVPATTSITVDLVWSEVILTALEVWSSLLEEDCVILRTVPVLLVPVNEISTQSPDTSPDATSFIISPSAANPSLVQVALKTAPVVRASAVTSKTECVVIASAVTSTTLAVVLSALISKSISSTSLLSNLTKVFPPAPLAAWFKTCKAASGTPLPDVASEWILPIPILSLLASMKNICSSFTDLIWKSTSPFPLETPSWSPWATLSLITIFLPLGALIETSPSLFLRFNVGLAASTL